MKAKLVGRVASCKEKTSKAGNGYYLLNMVQGEGTSYVESVFIYSNVPVKPGEVTLDCNVKAKEGNLSVSHFKA